MARFDEDMIINLHPALPGTFPGIHAIERAFDDKNMSYSGIMVHTVVEEMDAGKVIIQLPVGLIENLSFFLLI